MIEDRASAFLEALNDDACRKILGALETGVKSVSDLSEECDVPLSTTYRKIDRLQDAELVEEYVHINNDRKPKSLYELSFETAVITATDGEFEVTFVEDSEDDVAVPDVDSGTVLLADGGSDN